MSNRRPDLQADIASAVDQFNVDISAGESLFDGPLEDFGERVFLECVLYNRDEVGRIFAQNLIGDAQLARFAKNGDAAALRKLRSRATQVDPTNRKNLTKPYLMSVFCKSKKLGPRDFQRVFARHAREEIARSLFVLERLKPERLRIGHWDEALKQVWPRYARKMIPKLKKTPEAKLQKIPAFMKLKEKLQSDDYEYEYEHLIAMQYGCCSHPHLPEPKSLTEAFENDERWRKAIHDLMQGELHDQWSRLPVREQARYIVCACLTADGVKSPSDFFNDRETRKETKVSARRKQYRVVPGSQE